MWALSRPVLAHCATNSRCERRAIARVTHSDSGTVTTVSRASSGEMRQHHRQHGDHGQHRGQQLADRHRQRRLDVVDVVGDPAEHLTALPGVEVATAEAGAPCPRHRTAARTIVRCTTTLSSRACSQTSSAATRYSASASSRVRPTAAKSTPRPGTTFIPDSRSAKVLSPRARAAAIACSLVMPAGSWRPITPLNNRSVACPRMRGPMTPIAMPPTPSSDHRGGQAALRGQPLEQPHRRSREVARPRLSAPARSPRIGRRHRGRVTACLRPQRPPTASRRTRA